MDFVNISTQEIIPCQYEDVSAFSDGLAGVKQNGLWGFITCCGKEFLPFLYEDLLPFEDNYAPVKKDGKWGVINIKGEIAIPFEVEQIGDAAEAAQVLREVRPL